MDLTANQLLLRGLRAVYVDVWKTYDVMGHACQSPAELATAFPAEGVDLSSFREESPLRLKWRELTDPGNKNVSEELKDDISELLGIVDNTDKDKNFVITKAEWDAAHAKSSPEDELIDREYVLLAKGVFDYQLLDRPPGVINPEEYPELIASREKMKKELQEREGQANELAQKNLNYENALKDRDNLVASLRSEKNDAETQGDLFLATTVGLGGTLLVSALSLVFLRRRRSREPIHPDAQAAIRQQQIPDDGIPGARQRVAEPTVVVTPATEAENDEIEAELNRLTQTRTE